MPHTHPGRGKCPAHCTSGARVAAQALREAADVALLDRWTGWKWVAEAVSDWLRNRADKIERDGDE